MVERGKWRESGGRAGVGNTEIRELQRSKICDIFHSMFYCRRHLYSRIFKDPLNRKCKVFKNRQYSLKYFFNSKVVKLSP